jgi:hypothetical protein
MAGYARLAVYWDSKRKASAGEEWLTELVFECPRCREVRSYTINEDSTINWG